MSARISPRVRDLVLAAIVKMGQADRSTVAKHLGVSPNYVSAAVSELQRLGLIEATGETSPHTPGRGAPPRIFRPVERATA